MARGTVVSLHRWPVKSFAGEPVGALRVDGRGAGGDRTHALFDEFKGHARQLTVRQVPRMLRWAAAYPGVDDHAIDPADPPRPLLTAPDGRSFAWDDPGLPDALEADLGRPVTLVRDLAGQQDLGRSLLITTEASLRAVEAALGVPLDLRRFRPNVHVALDAPAYAEEAWQGRRLRVGETELELLHPCERCVIPTRDPGTTERLPELLRWLARERRSLFGINARAHGPGTLRTGDAVTLL